MFIAHPLRADFDNRQVSPQELLDSTCHLQTLAGTHGKSSVNLDGVLIHDQKNNVNSKKSGSYLQVDWNGAIVGVARPIAVPMDSGDKFIDAHLFYSHIKAISAYEEWIRAHGPDLHYVYAMAFTNVYGYDINIPPVPLRFPGKDNAIDRKTVCTKPWIVDVGKGSFGSRIMPGFEALWYSAGYTKAHIDVQDEVSLR